MCFCSYLIMGNAGVVVMFVMNVVSIFYIWLQKLSCPGCPRCNNSVVCTALFLPLKVDCRHLSELLA